MKKIINLSLVAAVLVTALNAGAMNDLKNSIQKEFGDSGAQVNGTDAGKWTDPSDGTTYYSGGSLTVKFDSTSNYSPWLSVRAPSIKAGCSGVTFDFGFVGIIDGQQLGEQLQKAGTSIVGGFVSALMYSTPILGDVIKTVKNIVARIQAMLQNACNIGKLGGDMLASKIDKEWQDSAIKQQKDDWLESAADNDDDSFASTMGEWADDVDNFTGCLASASPTNPNACDGQQTSTMANALASIPELKSSKIDPELMAMIKIANDKAVIVDHITLTEVFGGTPDSATDKATFLAAQGLATSNATVAQMVLGSFPIKVASTHICNILRYREDMAEGRIDAEEFFKSAAKEAKTMGVTSPEPTAIPPAFPSKDIVEFIQKGYVGNDASLKNNYTLSPIDIFVTQLPLHTSTLGKSSEAGNPELVRKMVACIGKPDDEVVISWDGIASESDVIAKLKYMAGESSSLPSTNKALIVSEVATAIATLQHKRTLTDHAVSIYNTPSLDYAALAKYNNYFIMSSIVKAFVEFKEKMTDPAGFNDSIVGSDGAEDTIAELRILKENMADGLASYANADETSKTYADRLKSDVEYIEKKYAIEIKRKGLK